MRGVVYLSGLDEAMVVDVGGTTTWARKLTLLSVILRLRAINRNC